MDRERAFDALFRANYAGLRRIATRILGSPARAEELVQDLFLWVWQRCPIIDESTPSRAYLYRAAHNAAVNRIRRERIEQLRVITVVKPGCERGITAAINDQIAGERA